MSSVEALKNYLDRLPKEDKEQLTEKLAKFMLIVGLPKQADDQQWKEKFDQYKNELPDHLKVQFIGLFALYLKEDQ